MEDKKTECRIINLNECRTIACSNTGGKIYAMSLKTGLITEEIIEEGLHFKENKDKEKFEDTPLFKKTPGYIPPGHIKRKKD